MLYPRYVSLLSDRMLRLYLALTQCLENFGPKIIPLKICFPELPKLFSHRDKALREALRDFFVEAYCWVGEKLIVTQLQKQEKIEHS